MLPPGPNEGNAGPRAGPPPPPERNVSVERTSMLSGNALTSERSERGGAVVEPEPDAGVAERSGMHLRERSGRVMTVMTSSYFLRSPGFGGVNDFFGPSPLVFGGSSCE